MINEMKTQISDKINELLIEEESVTEADRLFNNKLESLSLKEREIFMKFEQDQLNSHKPLEVTYDNKEMEKENSQRKSNSKSKRSESGTNNLDELIGKIKDLEKKESNFNENINIVKIASLDYYDDNHINKKIVKKAFFDEKPSNRPPKNINKENTNKLQNSKLKGKNPIKLNSSSQGNIYTHNYMKKNSIVDFSLNLSSSNSKKNKQNLNDKLSKTTQINKMRNIPKDSDDNLHIEFKSKIFSSKSSREFPLSRSVKD